MQSPKPLANTLTPPQTRKNPNTHNTLVASPLSLCLSPAHPPVLPFISHCPNPSVWVYEHMRLLVAHLNDLIGRLGEPAAGSGAPACSPATCPVMGCGDVQYLCGALAHGPEPHECCAIAYAVHTADDMSNRLSSSRDFPSRVSVPPAAAAAFPNVARRLYRVLAHAHRHPAPQFAEFEQRTRCAERTTAVCRTFGLLADDQLEPAFVKLTLS